MEPLSPLSRRRLVGSVASLFAIGSLAGCTSDDSSPDDGSNPGDQNGSETGDRSNSGEDNGSDDDDGSDDSGSGTGELDLSEANVVGVSVDGDGSSHRFDVTLHHDDDGEDGYANWWQVERLDGTQLGRRELLHAHSRQPFTRSETIGIPGGVDCVVVRGHDQTHGYGGQAMLVDVESGATRAIDQGAGPQSVDGSSCP